MIVHSDRNARLNAMLEITEGSDKVAAGIPMLLQEHPNLDPEIREVLEAVAVVVPLLSSALRQNFESALASEDSLTEVTNLLDKLEE